MILIDCRPAAASGQLLLNRILQSVCERRLYPKEFPQEAASSVYAAYSKSVEKTKKWLVLSLDIVFTEPVKSSSIELIRLFAHNYLL